MSSMSARPTGRTSRTGGIQGEPGELLAALEQLIAVNGIALKYEELPHGTKGVSRKG
jgi:hypothetical protein